MYPPAYYSAIKLGILWINKTSNIYSFSEHVFFWFKRFTIFREAFVKQSYKEGDEFDIRVRCFEQHFEIYVEHKLIANFKHYVPMSNISHIYVTGDVRLYAVSWEGKLYVSNRIFMFFFFSFDPNERQLLFFIIDNVTFKPCLNLIASTRLKLYTGIIF